MRFDKEGVAPTVMRGFGAADTVARSALASAEESFSLSSKLGGLNLVWAVLDRASRGWRGMTMTPTGTRLLAELRHQLLDPPTPIRRPDTSTNTETVRAVA